MNYIKRCFIVLVSIFFVGLGSTLMRMACLGLEAFTSLNYGISEVFNISLGNVMIVLSVLITVLTFIFYRKGLGPGTIIVMVCLGYAADFWLFVITVTTRCTAFNGLLRIPMFLTGMLIMIFFFFAIFCL